MTHTIFKQTKKKCALIIFLHDGQIALFLCFFFVAGFFYERTNKGRGGVKKKCLQVIFLFQALNFHLICIAKTRQGRRSKKLKKKILEAVIVVKTIIFPLVRDSSFQSLYKSLLFQDMQSLLNSIFVMS